MPVKTAIKPYCYLKPLGSNGQSIYLHNGETTRLSHYGRIVSPIENPELIHIRLKPDVTAKTLSTIYVRNYKGCWINDCMALCWYKYTLNHGHVIRLQADGYEYAVNFFPPPQEKVADLLLLKLPISPAEIPKKVMDELVSEAKTEYFQEKLKAKESKPAPKHEVGAGERKTEMGASVIEKTKATKKNVKHKKSVKSKKTRKSLELETPEPLMPKHVHFKTRPKPSQTLPTEEQVINTIDYSAETTAAVQTTDEEHRMERSTSIFRKVIFSAEAHSAKLAKKHLEKSVKFIPETGNERNVVIVEPEEEIDDAVEASKSEILGMVLELYGRMREDEREYARDKNFAMYLLDKVLRKVYRVKMDDVKFVQDLLDDVVENIVTMKKKDLAFAKKVVDDVVDKVFVTKRRPIEAEFFDWLLSHILKKIRELESNPQERKLVEVVASSSSSDDDDDSSKSSNGDEKKPVVKTVYEID